MILTMKSGRYERKVLTEQLNSSLLLFSPQVAVNRLIVAAIITPSLLSQINPRDTARRRPSPHSLPVLPQPLEMS